MKPKHGEESHRRLKQSDLVAHLLVLFSEEYERTEANSIADIVIPIADIREYLARKVGISYSVDSWITTQIHKYEDEIGTKLFRKTSTPRGPAFSLGKDLNTYGQKRHLYVTQKIRAANGVFDLILNMGAQAQPSGPIRLLLGAGSTVTRVAEIIAKNLLALPYKWDICTHNLGVIECLGKTAPGFEKAKLSMPRGCFDPATNLILGENLELYANRDFDWIIQGTSFLSGGQLFVEREDETKIKADILHECRGDKVLVLTGHEAAAGMPKGMHSFGNVADYSYIIHPSLAADSAAAQRLSFHLGTESPLQVMIRNWSYVILKPGT